MKGIRGSSTSNSTGWIVSCSRKKAWKYLRLWGPIFWTSDENMENCLISVTVVTETGKQSKDSIRGSLKYSIWVYACGSRESGIRCSLFNGFFFLAQDCFFVIWFRLCVRVVISAENVTNKSELHLWPLCVLSLLSSPASRSSTNASCSSRQSSEMVIKKLRNIGDNSQRLHSSADKIIQDLCGQTTYCDALRRVGLISTEISFCVYS